MIRPLATLLTLLPLAAHALESPPVSSTHTVASFVSETDSVRPGQKFRVGLRLKIQPNWHTYWQNPGDAGAPPTLDITGATAGPIAYPTPQRIQDGTFTSFAYTGAVLLPVTVTAPATAGTLHLQAHASWLVCEKICVPEEASFTLDLPAGSGAPGANADLFAAADAASPRPSPFPAHIGADGTLQLDAPGIMPASLYFFPADAGVLDQGAAQPFSTNAGGLAVHLKPLQKLDPAKHLAGVLVLTDRGGQTEALQIDAPPGPPAGGGAAASSALPGLPRALLLAFLGGLILNLMPCVLPVLAMKALALTRLSGSARGKIRTEAGLYTAGVLATFAAIGGVTLAVGAAGGAAGWGVQFQSAAFTAAMAWLMLTVGLSFFGLFEIGTEAAGVGQKLAARSSFFTGMLAVVVATPCTAPFMATALAATLVLPAASGMAIFLALGAGLAAPYALIAVVPGLARLLPRPGAWMERLKQILALPMFGAAAWLTWVVWHQAGGVGLASVVTGGVLVTLAAVAWGWHQRRGSRRELAFGALLASVLLLVGLAVRAPQAAPMALGAGAEAFSSTRLASLRAAHRPVLVDMSAAWCITCLVNERVALTAAPVRAAFARSKTAYLVGDWTRQDPQITAYLHDFGRDGVPLYVYYPAQGEPQVLPQILTQGEILGRLGG
jgi:thiol:disulfide interchange protein